MDVQATATEDTKDQSDELQIATPNQVVADKEREGYEAVVTVILKKQLMHKMS